MMITSKFTGPLVLVPASRAAASVQPEGGFQCPGDGVAITGTLAAWAGPATVTELGRAGPGYEPRPPRCKTASRAPEGSDQAQKPIPAASSAPLAGWGSSLIW